MKWFKHDASASEDTVIHKAEDEFGDAGYAAFFKILELMRDNFNIHYPGSLTISLKHLRKKLRKRSTSLELLLNFYQEEKKLTYQIKDGLVYIYMPNFKRYMDDYTRRVTRDEGGESTNIGEGKVRSNFDQKRREEKRKKDPSYNGSRLQVRGSRLAGLLPDVLKNLFRRGEGD